MFSKVGFRLPSMIDGTSHQGEHNDPNNFPPTDQDKFNRSGSCQMNRELTPEQIDTMIGEMMSWATPLKENSRTGTGIANATFIEKIARDGRVTTEDEQLILSCLDNQRSWWQALIVLCTLDIAIILPLLVIDEIPDNGHFSESTRNILSLVYFTGFGIAFYASVLQLLTTLMMCALSCYVIDIKSTLYLFMQCHDLFIWVNNAGTLPLLAFTISTIVGHILMVGPIQSIPCTIMGILTIIFGTHIYFKIVKPIFFGIFNSEFGTWENIMDKRQRNKNLKRQQASNSLSSLPSMKSFSRSMRASFKSETVGRANSAMIDEEAEVDVSSRREKGSGMLHDSRGSTGKLNPTLTSSHPQKPQLDQQAVPHTPPLQHRQTGMQQGHIGSTMTHQGNVKGEIRKKEQEDTRGGDFFFDEEEDINNNALDNDGSMVKSSESSDIANDAAHNSGQSWWEGPQNDELEVLFGRLEQERQEEMSPETRNIDAEAIDIERGGVPMDQHDNKKIPGKNEAASASKRRRKKSSDSPLRPCDEIDSGGNCTTFAFVQDLLQDSKDVKDSMMRDDLSSSLRHRHRISDIHPK